MENNNALIKDGEKKEETEYFNCAYFQMPKIADTLKKGCVVTVSGRIYLNEYKSKDGKHQANIACKVNNIKIVASFKGNSTAKPSTIGQTASDETDTDDLPF